MMMIITTRSMAIGRWSAVRLRRPFLSVNAHVIGRDASLMRTLAFRHFRMRVCLCVLLFDFISKKKETYRVVVHTILPAMMPQGEIGLTFTMTAIITLSYRAARRIIRKRAKPNTHSKRAKEKEIL